MSFLQVSRTGFKQPWNEAEIHTLAKDTPQEEMRLVEAELDSIENSSTFAPFSAGISQRWRNELRRIFVMFPRQQSQTITQIRLIFAEVRAEQEKKARIGNGPPKQNPFEILPPSLLVDFAGTLPSKTRARFAQVNRVFRDAVATCRTALMGPFVDNGRLMELLPYFYNTIPVRSDPSTFDAFQKELEKVLPEQLKDLQESSVLTDAEKAEFGKYPAYDIASQPELLLNFLETSHSVSLVTLVGQYKLRVLSANSALQSKVEASQRWMLKRQEGSIRLACTGRDHYKMTCIPKEVLSFSRVWELSFTNNVIRVIHPVIGTFTGLRSLLLCHNRLDGLPDSFRSLTNLTRLALEGNRFQNIPMFVAELPMLVSCDLPSPSVRPQPHSLQQSQAQAENSKLCTIQ